MAEGLQRAANAASESRRTTTGRPVKPWRVYGANSLHEDYRSETAAYGAVRELTGFGHAATVWQWADGSWQLYERIQPDETEASR